MCISKRGFRVNPAGMREGKGIRNGKRMGKGMRKRKGMRNGKRKVKNKRMRRKRSAIGLEMKLFRSRSCFFSFFV